MPHAHAAPGCRKEMHRALFQFMSTVQDLRAHVHVSGEQRGTLHPSGHVLVLGKKTQAPFHSAAIWFMLEIYVQRYMYKVPCMPSKCTCAGT